MSHAALSKGDRAWLQVEAARERRGTVRIPCEACGETVGHYRPARVAQPSVERAMVRLKCTRSGCRHETLIALDELVL